MQFNLIGKAVRRFRLPTVDYINAPIIIIPAQEGDINSRYFEITLYDDRGNIDLSDYTGVMFSGTTQYGDTLTSTMCEVSDDGKSVVVQFGGGFTARAGKVACDVMLTNHDKTVALTTQTFYVLVSESQASNDTIESDENYNLLLSLLREVGALEDRVEEAEEGRVAAEEARVVAEEARVEAESARETA